MGGGEANRNSGRLLVTRIYTESAKLIPDLDPLHVKQQTLIMIIGKLENAL